MNLTSTIQPTFLTVVVEHTNTTDISTPSPGISTTIQEARSWGHGTFTVQGYTNGDQNHTATNSSQLKINITTTPPKLNSPPDISHDEGTLGLKIPWIATDPEEHTGTYTVYRNNIWHGSGVWTNATSIDYILGQDPPGAWNYTIEVSDDFGPTTAKDTVLVEINPVDPSDNNPSDIQYVYGDTGNKIPWIISDPGSTTGSFIIYRNDTILNPAGSTWTKGTNINWNVDGLSAHTWNFTIEYWDKHTSQNISDQVRVTVHKATPTLNLYLNGTQNDQTYSLNQIMNLTARIIPTHLNVVIEFTNTTDISTPEPGTSNTLLNTNTWGPGTWKIQAHTNGNQNYTTTNSTYRTINVIGSPPPPVPLFNGIGPITMGWITIVVISLWRRSKSN
jgi:hypothetical protein